MAEEGHEDCWVCPTCGYGDDARCRPDGKTCKCTPPERGQVLVPPEMAEPLWALLQKYNPSLKSELMPSEMWMDEGDTLESLERFLAEGRGEFVK